MHVQVSDEWADADPIFELVWERIILFSTYDLSAGNSGLAEVAGGRQRSGTI
jgi:hypothetical protein